MKKSLPYTIVAVILGVFGIWFFYLSLFYIAGPALFTVSKGWKPDPVGFAITALPPALAIYVAARLYWKGQRQDRTRG